MKVEISQQPKLKKLDHLFVLAAEGADLDGIAADVAERAAFEGRTDETITSLEDEPRKVTLVGLGKREELTIHGLVKALGSVAKIAQKQRDKKIAVEIVTAIPHLDAEAATRLNASLLAQSDYKYDAYLTQKKEEKRLPIEATLVALESIDGKRLRGLQREADAVTDGIQTVRDLGNAPSNVMTPTRLAERAAEVAKKAGVKCTIYERRQIERMRMGGLLAVNRGSTEEPRFVVMEYNPRGAKKHVALVGKGITFDSGGISIKPAEKMEEMKFDMCGAAAVIGTIEAAAKLALPIRITGCIPSTDNLPSGSAYKPGEIITMMNGKTVEIVNTDAEGRMILGDALHYASNLKPDNLIDYATLTGAVVVALAGEAAGLFSNDDELARKLIESGERVGERLWRLPLWDEYKELIHSEWADMKNSGGRWGGSITAAVFLKEFVTCPSWAHLDIAGTAYTDHDPKGATGAGVRVTIEYLESLSR